MSSTCSDARILFTGGTGFLGYNIVPKLRALYDVLSPTRQELNLKDPMALREYVRANGISHIVHSANPNPVKSASYDSADSMFEDSLRVFMNIYALRNDVERILYFGSGAEYDKSRDICNVREEELGASIPTDTYGCTKFIMNQVAKSASNIVNLRLFGCYGPTDHESKFITHCIRCVLRGEQVTIRQDCLFDYLQVYDVAKVVSYFVNHEPRYPDYNVASGEGVLLSTIARKVMRAMGRDDEPVILTPGMNREYTASVSRLSEETGLVKEFIPLDEGIELQIAYERGAL